MDLKRAQRLITKIGAFLDNGNAHELSRLEKDLIRSYIVQLYDAVTDEPEASQKEADHVVEFVEYKMPKKETPKIETHQKSDNESTKSLYTDYDKKILEEKPVEPQITNPIHQPLPVEEKKSTPPPAFEPVKENVTVKHNQPSHEGLEKLFEIVKKDEASGRISHVLIPSIESAMGLNERIFTLNELFGGDKALFDATCSKLNHLHSFEEAQSFLMTGPARDYKWSEPARLKMAEQFIRIVSRRYPKSVS
jgi:hypothetical protein